MSRLKEMHTDMTELCSACKEKKICVGKWVELEITVLSKVRLRKTNTTFHLCVWG